MSFFDQPQGLGRTRSRSHSSQSVAGSPGSVAHSPTASTSSLSQPRRSLTLSPVVQPLRVSSRRLSGDAIAIGPFTPAASVRQERALRNRRPSGGGSILDLTNSSQADLFTSPLVTSVPQPSSSTNKRPRDESNGHPHPPTRPSQLDPFAPTKLDLNPDNSPSLSTLSCPICLGPPTPFALTSCGHAFCAPCLHSALVAAPALTPPPVDRIRTPGTRRARLLGLAGFAGETAAQENARLFMPSGRGRGGGRSGGTSAQGTDGEDEEPSELDKRCPLCRTVLKGGWGRSLRGVTLRVLPKKVPALPPADLTDEDDEEEGREHELVVAKEEE